MIRKVRAGFTLIELMIVVAIIGLLAALAIPNFIKFQARSRQSEAKTNLKAVFTAQKSYYGDKQMYLDLFDAIGFAPEYGNRYEYFASAGAGIDARTAPGTVPVAGASLACTGYNGVSRINTDQVKWPGTGTTGVTPYAPRAVAQRVANASSTVAGMTAVGVLPAATCCPGGVCEFLAEAEGNVDNDTTLDDWAIGSQGTGTAAGDNQTCYGGGTASGTTGVFSEGEPVNECNDVTF